MWKTTLQERTLDQRVTAWNPFLLKIAAIVSLMTKQTNNTCERWVTETSGWKNVNIVEDPQLRKYGNTFFPMQNRGKENGLIANTLKLNFNSAYKNIV